MHWFGVNVPVMFGVRTPALRARAKRIGKNHELTLELWKSTAKTREILGTVKFLQPVAIFLFFLKDCRLLIADCRLLILILRFLRSANINNLN
jgi:3-methyladenine DNA glycosylase AlkD